MVHSTHDELLDILMSPIPGPTIEEIFSLELIDLEQIDQIKVEQE